MRTSLLALAGAVFGAVLTIALGSGAQAAAQVTYSQACAEIMASGAPVVKVVTRAGVAHRSARRTSRRVYRRHAY
jgi:hypothetical protein